MAASYSNTTARCSLCDRELSASAPLGGMCERPGCAAPICRTCFAVRGRRFCPQHSQPDPLAAEPSAPAAPALDADVLWGFLREARAAELNFITRFQANTERQASVPVPGAERPLAIRNWAELRGSSDSAPDLKRLLPTIKALSEVRTLCPVNPVCRYTIRRPPLVLEARCCADLAALVQRAGEAPPLSLDYLLRTLHDLDAAATRNDTTVVAGLFSLTGWDEDSVGHLVGDASHPALVAARVSACLIGPALGQLRANPTDRRLQSYLPLFRGETLEEEAARCKAEMLQELFALDRVFVNAFARDHQFTPEAALLAARDLARERSDVEPVDIPDVGPALRWRK